MNRLFIVPVLVTFIAVSSAAAFSRDGYDDYDSRLRADTEVVNRPVNIQGLTGLLFTNSAYTQPAGSITFGVSGLAEDSDDPNNSMAQGFATITIGFSDRVEVGLRGRMIGTSLGSATDREIGIGDSELLLKWRFSSQGDTLPAFALGFGWTFPTGSSDKGLTEVKYEGLKAMVIAAAENRVLEDRFVGIYLEAQAVFNDQLHSDGDNPYKEKYGVVNAGMLFPLSDDNRLQFSFEYNRVLKKHFMTVYEGSYEAVTPALRYVTENFNINFGVQRIEREKATPVAGATGSRLCGTMSYRF